jgi:hypothetical protein
MGRTRDGCRDWAVELGNLVVVNGLQLVEISHPGCYLLIDIFILSPCHPIAFRQDKRADPGIRPNLSQAPDDKETGVLKFRGGFPGNENEPIPRCSGEADQGNSCSGIVLVHKQGDKQPGSNKDCRPSEKPWFA